jgi:hypothetical protein
MISEPENQRAGDKHIWDAIKSLRADHYSFKEKTNNRMTSFEVWRHEYNKAHELLTQQLTEANVKLDMLHLELAEARGALKAIKWGLGVLSGGGALATTKYMGLI